MKENTHLEKYDTLCILHVLSNMTDNVNTVFLQCVMTVWPCLVDTQIYRHNISYRGQNYTQKKRKKEHLHAADEVFSDALWNGYRKSSLFPLLPELTSITLMGLVFSPFGCRLDSDCFHISSASAFKSTDHCLYILVRFLMYLICSWS